MATLTQSQIYTIAVLTGLPNPKVMAAVAMAESSGRTDVVNSIGCVGLWQINQPVHVKSHPTWTQDWLKNPINNAMAAKVIYQQQGLAAWEAYTNGAYGKFLNKPVSQQANTIDQVKQASWWDPLDLGGLGDVLGDTPGLDIPVLSDIGQVAEGVFGIAETGQKAAMWLAQPKNWLRIVYVTAGGFIVIAAVISIAGKTSAAQKVKSAVGSVVSGATSVAPGGGTLKGAGRALGSSVKNKVSPPKKAAAPAKKAASK